jgi:hypothetical protein
MNIKGNDFNLANIIKFSLIGMIFSLILGLLFYYSTIKKYVFIVLTLSFFMLQITNFLLIFHENIFIKFSLFS